MTHFDLAIVQTIVRSYWRNTSNQRNVGRDIINLCATFLHFIGPLVCISRKCGHILLFDVVHNIWNILSNNNLRSSKPDFCHVVRGLSSVKCRTSHDGIVTAIQTTEDLVSVIKPTLLTWKASWTHAAQLNSKSLARAELYRFRNYRLVPLAQLSIGSPVLFNVVANLSYSEFVHLLNECVTGEVVVGGV